MTATQVRQRRRSVFRSVFQPDVSQPTPLLPPTEAGEPFGGPRGQRQASLLAPVGIASLGDAGPDRGTATSIASGTGSPATALGRSKRTNAGNVPQSDQDQELEQQLLLHNQAAPQRRGRPQPQSKEAYSDSEQQVRWDRAWHVITSRIQLPASVAVEDSFGTLAPESQDLDGDAAFYEVLPLVLNPRSALPRATHTEDILLWHTQQVRQHFVHHVLPLLAACAGQRDRGQVLLTSMHTLEAAHRQYFYGLSLIVRGLERDNAAAASAAVAKFRRDLHAVIGNSWTQGFLYALRETLSRLLAVVLGLKSPLKPLDQRPSDASQQSQVVQVSAARSELFNLVESLHAVGLAGDKFQILFAEIMNACMVDFIRKTYSCSWKAKDTSSSSIPPRGCVDHLRDWVENEYSRLAVEVLSRLGGHIAWADVESWLDIAVGRLATLRMHELFDMVLHWPESRAGLEDLSSIVVTPQRRLQLTDVFSAVLQKRLLHPGRSTIDILQTYIAMIRTFHVLDQSKVLLNRVVQALQLYLCQRDDAIRIVVTGLLSDPKDVGGEEGRGKLVELAVILNDSAQQQRRLADFDDLDWNDMTWVPDPVDAGVNYKRPKNEDVIGTLITALGSQDIFIKEFQQIIAEGLLSNQPALQQATKVLGLLKRRFGESALQNCDVMIKDIQDSKRVDAILQKEMRDKSQGADGDLAYHSRILSRLFWPSMAKESFTVPGPVAEAQRHYAAGFQQLKSSRKLSWLDQLGTATVKLDLEDRSVDVDCTTYEAAVIYAFQDDGSGAARPQQRTFNELWEGLTMDEDLLELALRFWMSKRVLRDVGSQTYVVLERLGDKDKAAEAADEASQTEAGAGISVPSPRKPKMDAKERERRAIYWQFVVGMLTNSGPAMPLSQIAMMMKMLIADGCPWSNEEIQEFLGEKVAEEELEFAGGKYRLPKK